MVKWFNKANGYGFIQQEGGKEVLFLYSALQKNEIGMLKEGQEVEFVSRETRSGTHAYEFRCMV
ncbi:MAG: cold shock domain-containing protein [Thermodesulfobacteriota bacterium]